MLTLKLKISSFGASLALALALGSLAPQTTAALTAKGEQLKQAYEEKHHNLQTQIIERLPQIDQTREADYHAARQAELDAFKPLKEADARLAEYRRAHGLVGHARGHWIGNAEQNIRRAKEKIENAGTDSEREAAKQELAAAEQNLRDGQQALLERTANYEQLKQEKPAMDKAREEARKALEQAQAATLRAVMDLGVESALSSDALDPLLAKFIVVHEATPKGLAKFAQQSEAHHQLVDNLLADTDLMLQMLVADGAKDGNYGRAMQIYTDIQNVSEHAAEGALQRFAVGIALEHATPRALRNIKVEKDAPKYVDPVNRYLHFEEAYFHQELDPGFDTHSAWAYRFVVDGEEPDKILTWGREMMRNFRPDHVTTNDQRWRYVAIVRSDVPYGSQNVRYDQDHLHFFQNILMNAGICGRRAFIGRFVLRSFGVPTIARPSRAHGALARWTPDGWVPMLGPAWGNGWTRLPYDRCENFEASTRARATGEHYLQVKRAQWIGDVIGERREYGFASGRGQRTLELWNAISLYTQRALIEAADLRALDAVGEDIAEASDTREAIEITQVVLSEEERRIHRDFTGAIHIPAAATSSPTRSTRYIQFHDSVLGGQQLHHGRNASGHAFEYTFDAPAAGQYELTARVVTPTWRQTLRVSANGADEIEIDLPFTVGMWEHTAPVTVELQAGENLLTFNRKGGDFVRGVAFRDFKLKPVPNPGGGR